MRYFLSIAILFFVSAMFAQTRVDTVRCGDMIGVGKIVNGKKEGLWHYHDKIYTTPIFTGNYHKGEKTGEWIIFPLPYTYMKRVVHYKNNTLDGTVTCYYENKLRYKGSYLNGLKNGEWVNYNYDGVTISSIGHYQNGIPVGRWQYFGNHSCWSGEMTVLGANGYWVHKDTIYSNEDPNNLGIYLGKQIILDSVKYVNGKEEGFWKTYVNGNSSQGNYIHGKKEGRWITSYKSSTTEVLEYKNGLQNGYDSIWVNDTISEVDFYSEEKMNGPQLLFTNGKLISEGLVCTNPHHYFNISRYKRIEVPTDILIDLIENGICNVQLYALSDEGNCTPRIKDSLIQILKNAIYVPDSIANTSDFSLAETVRLGHWNFYWKNGNKKEEGNYLPLVRDSVRWDSTNEVEDPNNIGTFILAPLKLDSPIYCKTGWWKYYNEQGVMIREERYDEKGILVETILKPH